MILKGIRENKTYTELNLIALRTYVLQGLLDAEHDPEAFLREALAAGANRDL